MGFSKPQISVQSDPPQSQGPLVWAKSHLLLRNEAHHRATLNCEAPAITWHVGFWPERHNDPQDALTAERFNERLRAWIEDRVQVLVKRLLALGQPPGARVPKTFWIDTNDNSLGIDIWTAKPKAEEFHLLWRGLKVQTRIEIHPDYASATFVVALGRDSDNVGPAREAEPHGDTPSQDEFVNKLHKAVADANDPDAAQASVASLLLYRDAWRTFIFDVLDANELSHDTTLIPGEIFVSLRGVVLKLGETESHRPVNVLSVHHNGLSNTSEAARKTFDAEEADDAIMRLERFLSRGDFKHDDREFVAARIIQERAIFISPFGARSLHEVRDDPDHSDPRRSTRFAILTKGEINSRQLGRTVSQINSLGTLQIIALKDIPVIRAVGTAIRLENDVLDQCAKQLTSTIGGRNWVPDTLELRLCELESRLDDVANLPTGGLTYRVFRSAYYANEFRRRLENLDAKEISRWQRPETFFAKRLFSVFDYIQNVGARMERLRRRISSSLETIQTKTLVDLTRGVHKIQRSGEIVSTILFVVAVSTFFGEVLEPAHQAGLSTLQILPLPQECIEAAGSASDVCRAASRLNGYLLGVIVALGLTVAFFGGRWAWRLARNARRQT